MLSTKIILAQQRSRQALGGKVLRLSKNRGYERASCHQRVRWIYVPDASNDGDADNEGTGIINERIRGSSRHSPRTGRYPAVGSLLQHHQRRHLTTGRPTGWKSDSEKKEKENFSKKFLEPAARGELAGKHSSNIPKLAVRKSKGHNIQGVPDGGEFDQSPEEEFGMVDTSTDGALMDTLAREVTEAKNKMRGESGGGPGGPGGGPGGPGGGPGGPGERFAGPSSLSPYFPPSSAERGVYTRNYDNGKSPEYWREEDYDEDVLTVDDRKFILDLVGRTPEGQGRDDSSLSVSDYEFNLESIGFHNTEDDIEEEVSSDENKKGKKYKKVEDGEKTEAAGEGEVPEGRDNSEEEEEEDEDVIRRDKKLAEEREEALAAQAANRKVQNDCITPFTSTADDPEEFWKDLHNHPTMYAEVRLYNHHAESKREPKPYYPKNIKDPAPEFLEFYRRWVFVTGLPPALSDEGMKHGVVSELTVAQEQEIQMTMTKLFGVPSDEIFPANETSAFVGFEIPEDRERFLREGPKEKTLRRPVEISTYTPTPEDEKRNFLKDASLDTVVQLKNLPPGRYSRDSLARELFPEGSDLGNAYPLTRDDIVFPSKTTALLRFNSAEQAESARSSETVAARLAEIGEYPVRMFRARRNLIFAGWDGPLRGPRNKEVRRRGDRLIIDGHMPSKNFHISHAGTIMLHNLDRATVTKASLTEFFQPFSKLFRDENSSIEFVTCENGLPTGIAYVGFDSLGEAEAVVKHFNGRARIGENDVRMVLVKDRKVRGQVLKRVARPERTEEEILMSLNGWEQYVDPKDLAYLEEHGVAKVVIDETMRQMRFHNRSFGPLDLAMQGEKLENEKESGADYKEMVQMYISTLKECVATPENPGILYEYMHFPDEPIDLSIFEKEKQRQKRLMKKREGL